MEINVKEIPTAEEFFEQGGTYPELAIKFAKLHVKAALEAAAENAEAIPYSEGAVGQCGVDKDSIFNAYPENLIK